MEDCSTLTDQRLKSFVDQSQLFLSAAQPGHLDLLSASGETRLIITKSYVSMYYVVSRELTLPCDMAPTTRTIGWDVGTISRTSTISAWNEVAIFTHPVGRWFSTGFFITYSETNICTLSPSTPFNYYWDGWPFTGVYHRLRIRDLPF